jgi:putative PIN family toxin of toxin-antitoxin system
MKIIIDANILISAFLKSDTTPNKTLVRAFTPPNILVLSDQLVYELNKFYAHKFTYRASAVADFIHTGKYEYIELTPADKPYPEEALIRDVNDRPILRAALKAEVDVLVTGDKDFLESGVKIPRILTAADFINT